MVLYRQVFVNKNYQNKRGKDVLYKEAHESNVWIFVFKKMGKIHCYGYGRVFRFSFFDIIFHEE